MKIGDEVITVSKALASLGVQASKHKIIPASPEQTGSITVPRLFTFWKGQAEDDSFQANIKEAVVPAQVSIEVRPWSHAPGYPMGNMGEITIDE